MSNDKNTIMPRIESINILRILGALLITIYHMDFQASSIQNIKCVFSGIGNYSVVLFIIISGFLNAYNDKLSDIKPISIARNVKKRVTKVYPLHVATLLAVLAYKLLTKSFESTDGIAFPLNLFMIQGFVPVRSIYYSFNKLSWYLSLYLLFSVIELPIVYVVRKLNSKKRVILCIGIILSEVLWLTAFQNNINSHWFCYICPLFRCFDYILGIITGSFFRDQLINNKIIKSSIPSLILVVGYIIIAFVSIACKLVIPFEYYKVFYSISCCVLVYLFANIHFSSDRIKLIIQLGALSFDWYLVHQIVIGVLTQIIKNEAISFCCVILCTALGVFIWNKLFGFIKSIFIKHSLNH